MKTVDLILESINCAKTMISFREDVLNSVHKIFFNWKYLFGKENDLDDSDYAFLFYCVDFFDEALINVDESKLPPLSREEKMMMFYEKGKEGSIAQARVFYCV